VSRDFAIVSRDFSLVIGHGTNRSRDFAIVIAHGTHRSCDFSIVIGHGTNRIDDFTILVGREQLIQRFLTTHRSPEQPVPSLLTSLP
jgi:hypothetical protein